MQIPIDEPAACSTEEVKVNRWRLHTLLEAGYPLPLAEKLAAAGHVDLHRAVELLGRNCRPEMAARILL